VNISNPMVLRIWKEVDAIVTNLAYK
jgi:hypothetical protein